MNTKLPLTTFSRNFKSDYLVRQFNETASNALSSYEYKQLDCAENRYCWNHFYEKFLLSCYAQLIEEFNFLYCIVENTFLFEPIVLYSMTNSKVAESQYKVLHAFSSAFIQKIMFSEKIFYIRPENIKLISGMDLPKTLHLPSSSVSETSFTQPSSDDTCISSTTSRYLYSLYAIASHAAYHYLKFTTSHFKDMDYRHNELHKVTSNRTLFLDNVLLQRKGEKLNRLIDTYVFGPDSKKRKFQDEEEQDELEEEDDEDIAETSSSSSMSSDVEDDEKPKTKKKQSAPIHSQKTIKL